MKEELINKLYLQSQIQRDTEWGENVTFFDYRKFANLIVKECINVCNEFGADIENGDILRSNEDLHRLLASVKDGHIGVPVWLAADEIKKHFGVE